MPTAAEVGIFMTRLDVFHSLISSSRGFPKPSDNKTRHTAETAMDSTFPATPQSGGVQPFRRSHQPILRCIDEWSMLFFRQDLLESRFI